ncbi:unnamed protein product [Orchesella dallaii]|uniref:Uncharacterized protein n=1 Tax=Orchesella dallaii TaxID=48710 RepID=A0ABP1Q9L4_9HEXA
MSKSEVEEKNKIISNFFKMEEYNLRFDYLTVEAYKDPNILYAIIEVFLNLPLTYFRSNREREKFQQLAGFVKQYNRKTRKEKRICDVLNEIKRVKEVVFDVLQFGSQRVITSYYEPREDRRLRRRRFYSIHNDFYICAKNVVHIINENAPPRVKKRKMTDRLLEVLETHFGCMICFEVIVDVSIFTNNN